MRNMQVTDRRASAYLYLAAHEMNYLSLLSDFFSHLESFGGKALCDYAT